MTLLSPNGPEFTWDPLGYMVIVVPADERDERVAHDAKLDRHLVAEMFDEHGSVHLKYRLRMAEDELDRGGRPTGTVKISWDPKLSKPVGLTDDTRWQAPPAPDPKPMVPPGA